MLWNITVHLPHVREPKEEEEEEEQQQQQQKKKKTIAPVVVVVVAVPSLSLPVVVSRKWTREEHCWVD